MKAVLMTLAVLIALPFWIVSSAGIGVVRAVEKGMLFWDDVFKWDGP